MGIDFQGIQLGGGQPVYQQVVHYFKKQILLGNLRDNEEIPSRRSLAAALGINPTTVQKIYRQLETEGLIETSPNARSVVSLGTGKLEELRRELTREQALAFLGEMRSCGLDFRQVVDLITRLWDEEG